MSSIIENVIATIIATIMSTVTEFILQITGLSPQLSFSAAIVVLFACVMLFLATRKYYPVVSRRLTEKLLESALRVRGDELAEDRREFKNKIVERVLLEKFGVQPLQSSLFKEYPNQVACEDEIIEAFRSARKVKILTIRGEKYFLGSKSLLHDICLEKRERDCSMEVLVLSPESGHITEQLAESLGHRSTKRIRRKMSISLENLNHIAGQNKNFEVKRYNEEPNFKILMFDDVMFVSSFVGGGPKNDHNARMFQLTREGNPLFAGFERYFDDLSKRSVTPQ